ncbi:hypothetical protein [Nocardioides sp. LML1-1-1.1]|uniref:hypothetical protein n=1 Tax=Nocardioides sp. LML1-1-1.1 TaxID=3135248 RepID=UPI003426CFB5
MTLSLHLVEHRVRELPAFWRHRPRLAAEIERVPGVAHARLGADIALTARTGGRPRVRRTALLVAWHDRAARDACLGAGWPAAYVGDARESWSLALDAATVVRGAWRGWQPDTSGVERLRPEEPVVVVTYAAAPPRGVPAFFRGNREVCRALDANAAETFRLGFLDGRLGFGTVTMWRSQKAMTQFTYRGPVHEPARRRVEEKVELRDHFFARFRPVASYGTWHGGDPLADLRREVDTATDGSGAATNL